MKTFKTKLLTIAALLCSISASAHDFEVDGIYYDITSSEDLTVEVTYGGRFQNSALYHGSVKIPNTVEYNGNTYSVTSIGTGAFYKCTDLTDITIPNSVTSIGKEAFSGTPWYEQQPDGIIYVNNVLYKYKGEMPANTSIEIKEGTISISCYAFDDCTGLTSITIPNSVTSIGDYAFSKCDGLISVHIADLEAWCKIDIGSDDATSIYNPLSYASHLYVNGEEIKDLVIPSSVTSIAKRAFYECTFLTSITIPESVTSIGNLAFYGCKNLKTVINFSELTIERGRSNHGDVGYYADKVINADEQIGDFFFKTTDGIDYLNGYIGRDNDLVLPDNYKGGNYQIGSSLFYNCTSLTSITIPNSVTSIGDEAFYNCDGLTSITIPNSVTSIGDKAFYNCDGLTSITIPNSVTSIGDKAFYNCDGLTSITIPNSVTSIGEYTFYGDENITDITIGNSVTSIGGNAFEDCANLTSIVIPESLTDIGNLAFYNCENLKTIINYSKLNIKEGFSSYGYVGYYAVKVINFGDLKYEQYGDFIFRNEENFKFYLSAYTGNESCPSLPENFYGKAYEIDDYAFFCNRSITDITIPEFVTSIGDCAFDECENLKTITIATATPPKVGKRNFSTMSFRTVVVKVPQGSLAAYQAADFWQSFWNIEEFGSNNIEGVEMNVNSVTAPIYNLQGVQMNAAKENLPAGIYIQGGKKFVVK